MSPTLLTTISGSAAWEFWADFRKPAQGRPAEALLTLTGWKPSGLNSHHITPLAAPAPKNRTARLAIHGSLVEFEGRLYTATIRSGKSDISPHIEREMLHLGSAIEVKDRVWYQAGTTTPRRGQGVSVEEWRIEFRDDPRTADRGKATLRGHWRVLTKSEGESFDSEVSFQAGKTYTGGRTVTLNWPHGMRQTRSLPHLEIDDYRGGANIMRLDDMHRLSLYPAPKPRPEPISESLELVQPPEKKPGK